MMRSAERRGTDPANPAQTLFPRLRGAFPGGKETMSSNEPTALGEPQRVRYVPVIGVKLKKLLAVVFGLFALLMVNSVYLIGSTILETVSGTTYQRRNPTLFL